MWMDALYVLLLLAGIVGVCAVFTNAVEWLGEHLNLSDGAVGSIFAAVGTALPETIVPIVAIVSGVLTGNTETAAEIGVGAILGAPFMLGTLAFALSGLTVLIGGALKHRSLAMTVDKRQFHLDGMVFMLGYGLAVGAAFIPPSPWQHPLRYGIAAILILLYSLYVRQTLQASEAAPTAEQHEGVDVDADEHLEPLWLTRVGLGSKEGHPSGALIYTQLALALAGIVGLAHLFVHEIEHLSLALKVPALILSLIIIPIATELPEKFNSILWLIHRKDTLAIGNLSGAMVFQSCIPGAIGLAFTPWHLESLSQLNVVVTLLSSTVMFGLAFRVPAMLSPWVLLLGGGFYGYFLYHVLQAVQHSH